MTDALLDSWHFPEKGDDVYCQSEVFEYCYVLHMVLVICDVHCSFLAHVICVFPGSVT